MKFFIPFISAILLFINIKAQNIHSSDSIHIIHYNINLNITDFGNKKIKGNTTLTIENNNTIGDTLYLYLQGLEVDSVLLHDSVFVNCIHHGKYLHIPLATQTNNDTIKATIYYLGTPEIDPSTWGGFYFQSNYAYNLGVGFLDNPHSYGRVWFPCIDEFTDKSLYNFHITTNPNHKAICNGLLTDTTHNADSTITYHWTLNEPMPAYLASVAVGDYVAYNDTYNGINENIPIEIYTRPGETSKVAGSFANLKSISNIYETYYGPYLWERIGYVGVPFNGGAMEHATTIAYPNVCINGADTYESLYAHELSHHWFGNLVTCSTAAEMWLNEGWARYSEALYREFLYSQNAYNNYIANLHAETIQFAHIDDENYFGLSNAPHEYTYGTTVYDKGACAVHSLRNFMGDSLFFDAVKHYLDTFKFQSVSIDDMQTVFENKSGLELEAFFNTWVHAPGYPHFRISEYQIDSISLSNFNITFTISQKQNGGCTPINNMPIDVSFVDKYMNCHTKQIATNGTNSIHSITIDFNPQAIFLDINNKMTDAITDYTGTIKQTGNQALEPTFAYLDLETIQDSVFVRMEHNWVAPSSNVLPDSVYRISDYRYWSFYTIANNNLQGTLKFKYITTSTQGLDHTFLPTQSSTDSLVLLYRPCENSNWQIIPFAHMGNATMGYLKTNFIKTGQYAFAIGEPTINIIPENITTNQQICYPNPTQNKIFISNEYLQKINKICIYSINGKLVKTIFNNNKTNKKINISDLKNGIYTIHFELDKKTITNKIIIEK